MNSSILNGFITLCLPLILAGIGYLIKQGVEQKRELNIQVLKERREMYQGFVNIVIDLVGNVKAKTNVEGEISVLPQLYDFYKKYVLFASPEVINAFAEYFQFIYNQTDHSQNTKVHIEKLTKIMFEMREDLGLENRNLGLNGEKLLRAMFKDYDTIMQN